MSTTELYGLIEHPKYGGMDPDYAAKMMHEIPDAPVLDREAYIFEKCKGKVVMNLGSDSGALHEGIVAVASKVYGVDKAAGPRTDLVCDIDREPEKIGKELPHVDIAVCGEVLEHLANPGRLLDELKGFHCDVLITVPNAFASGAPYWLKKYKAENVNPDHVAWYSYHTLKVLLSRYQFSIVEWGWYKGLPLTAEGLIVLAR